MTGAALIQLLGSAAVAGVLVAVINAVVTRKKLGAEATKIITDAASGVVANFEADNKRLRDNDISNRAQIDALEARIDDLEDEQHEWHRERREWMRALQLHAAWDAMAVSKLRDCNPAINLPHPPPLTSPTVPRTKRTDD